MKGKPWTVEEEKQLREMVQQKKSLVVMAKAFGKSPESIKKKMLRLGLKVVVRQIQQTTTSNELLSVEEALQKLNNALVSLETPGLDQAETLRLRSIIQGRKIYLEKFAEYLNYRELEQRLIELEGNYAVLVKKAPTFPAA
ncbi:SANT/Myb-like DNA-binding domain-containing protein [Candidatus Bathyarchaeota archaeon]|nr:SANT/Myb-like DNA-binding domain-containing protein [Candidatus Bathyarchaeota archaeon]